jgi:hypothetical protein
MTSISTTACHLAARAKTAASSARGSLIDLRSNVLGLANNMGEHESNGALLASFGKRREPSRLLPVLWFAAGDHAAADAMANEGGKSAQSSEDRQAAH